MSDMLLQLNDIGNFGSDQVPLVTYGIVGTGTFMAAVVIFRLFDYFFGGPKEEGSPSEEELLSQQQEQEGAAATDGKTAEEESSCPKKPARPSLFSELMEDMGYALVVSAVSLFFTWLMAGTLFGDIPEEDEHDLDLMAADDDVDFLGLDDLATEPSLPVPEAPEVVSAEVMQ